MAINQGELLLAGRGTGELLWKIPLTYLVPFVVATAGALTSGRSPSGRSAALNPARSSPPAGAAPACRFHKLIVGRIGASRS